jgi:hypothetical protein
MEACYGGTDVMERSCAVARGIGINILHVQRYSCGYKTAVTIHYTGALLLISCSLPLKP